VFIYDHASDLFIYAGDVVDIQGNKALVMVTDRARDFDRKDNLYRYIADWFDMDKLHVKKSSRKKVG